MMPQDEEARLRYRAPVLATHGMAASEHPLVTQTGIDVMRRGGNAFDAALAMSALLPVVKPGRSHLGGDAYILARRAGEQAITAICSGGKAPAAATRERYAAGIPQRGGAAAAVPGLVDAWQVFGQRWCSMAPRDLLAPAIAYAREGFAVSRELELVLAAARGMFTKYDGLARILYVDGEPPRMGQVLRQPALARTLEAVAEGGRDAFYRGEAARAIARAVQAAGGYMTEDDLAGHEADVLAPLSVTYRGFTVYETPPNSQGLILLEELKIVEGYGLAAWGHLSPDAVHHMVEAKKLAFEDRLRFAGDPSSVAFESARMLTDEWAAERRKRIDPDRASAAGVPSPANDTTSFVVADAAGNLCSFIQSLYAPFGCAIGVPELGIIMNNRMTGFSLDPASPNVLAPGKRTMHTLNTYMIFRDGRPFMIGNTPGGDYQVQTNLQVITGVLDFGLDVQAAVDAPRWGHGADGLIVEREMPVATREELSRRGHDVIVQHRATNPTGRPQAIVIDQESGAFAGGSDSRGEGAAAGW